MAESSGGSFFFFDCEESMTISLPFLGGKGRTAAASVAAEVVPLTKVLVRGFLLLFFVKIATAPRAGTAR